MLVFIHFDRPKNLAQERGSKYASAIFFSRYLRKQKFRALKIRGRCCNRVAEHGIEATCWRLLGSEEKIRDYPAAEFNVLGTKKIGAELHGRQLITASKWRP